MSTGRIDPEGNETVALHGLVDFSGKDVLEIGCGNGRMTSMYADEASSVLAIDLDESAIAAAREQVPLGLASQVTFQVADATTAPLEPKSYDVVVLAWSI